MGKTRQQEQQVPQVTRKQEVTRQQQAAKQRREANQQQETRQRQGRAKGRQQQGMMTGLWMCHG
jgi:hypothetical protein